MSVIDGMTYEVRDGRVLVSVAESEVDATSLRRELRRLDGAIEAATAEIAASTARRTRLEDDRRALTEIMERAGIDLAPEENVR